MFLEEQEHLLLLSLSLAMSMPQEGGTQEEANLAAIAAHATVKEKLAALGAACVFVFFGEDVCLYVHVKMPLCLVGCMAAFAAHATGKRRSRPRLAHKPKCMFVCICVRTCVCMCV